MQRPRGTRDHAPEEMERRIALEMKLHREAELHGFRPVRTPIFEHIDLFTAKSGPDIVDQLYTFNDKSGREMTLRPELTAPIMRMISQGTLRERAKPLRLCYSGPCFRYEEAKKGRWREFDQFGIELIGSSGPLAEAEVLACAISMLEKSGVDDWHVKIGNVEILRNLLSASDFPDELTPSDLEVAIGSGWTQKSKNEHCHDMAMRLIDKGSFGELKNLFSAMGADMGISRVIEELASISSERDGLESAKNLLSKVGIGETPLRELETCLKHLRTLGALPDDLRIDFTVARGLDYYTGMVFEAHVESLRGESQVLGGGSYKLMHLFELPELDPCCGFGLGTDRILLALENTVASPNLAKKRIAVIPLKIDVDLCLHIVTLLRKEGIGCEIETRASSLGKSLKWASSSGFTHAIIVGPEDLEKKRVTLRNLSTGEQKNPSDSNLISEIHG